MILVKNVLQQEKLLQKWYKLLRIMKNVPKYIALIVENYQSMKPPMPNTLKESTQRKKVVKAWGIFEDGELLTCWTFAHSTTTFRIYRTAESARNVARKLIQKDSVEIKEIIITYNISK